MQQELVSILACPRCRGQLTLEEVRQSRGTRILSGTLECRACSACYPVEAGVPRLVEAEPDVQTIGRRFEFEWVSRWMGRFEGAARCHGMDLNEYVGWQKDRLAEHSTLAPGDRILDAGCGSGEKAALLAKMCPRQTVVGLDLGLGNLEKAAERYGDIENVNYVQGNILRPPLRWNSFRWGISIGVLHHTPDTRRAFAMFRKLLVDDPGVLVYLYRPLREAPEWRACYIMRDVFFLGQSPKLPPGFLRLFCLTTVGLTFPLSMFIWWRHGRRMKKELPFYDTSKMTLRDSYWAQTFHLFDLLLPQYQFRPRSSEVEAWFREEGLEMAFQAHCFYLGRPAQRAHKRETAGALDSSMTSSVGFGAQRAHKGETAGAAATSSR
jgi:uncharacterized protein YbaR (Trm112 family)/SAM-dependent methyltransferase